ncbi:MAG: MerR family transcriptional regulator [Micavibrio sp.]|jgi:DNA-binding transcriptional MerR regulator|nr:MerR family transcriptional regulator [Micavibrio sp.]MBK9563487.1 MerR family transcriptional regulator [Micavibrio sp.]
MNAQSGPLKQDQFQPSVNLVAPEAPKQDAAPQAPEATEKSRKAPSAFRTISEVADDLNVQQHVLRFWETKFSQVRPLKRGGGRRYYRPEDVDILKTIHHLLYTQGYTIKGVQKLFREQGKNKVVEKTPPEARNSNVPQQAPQKAAQAGLSDRQRAALQSLAGELKELRAMIAETE